MRVTKKSFVPPPSDALTPAAQGITNQLHVIGG